MSCSAAELEEHRQLYSEMKRILEEARENVKAKTIGWR